MSYFDQWNVPEEIEWFSIDGMTADCTLIFCTECDDSDTVATREIHEIIDYIVHHIIDVHNQAIEN